MHLSAMVRLDMPTAYDSAREIEGEERERERMVRNGGGQKRKMQWMTKMIKYVMCLTLKGNIGHVPTALNVGFASRRSLGAQKYRGAKLEINLENKN